MIEVEMFFNYRKIVSSFFFFFQNFFSLFSTSKDGFKFFSVLVSQGIPIIVGDFAI